MTVKCDKCWTLYNPKTVSKCPACHPNRSKNDFRHTDVGDYRHETIRSGKKVVNSARASSLAKWEREHGKKVF